jgi:hypothetical protein
MRVKLISVELFLVENFQTYFGVFPFVYATISNKPDYFLIWNKCIYFMRYKSLPKMDCKTSFSFCELFSISIHHFETPLMASKAFPGDWSANSVVVKSKVFIFYEFYPDTYRGENLFDNHPYGQVNNAIHEKNLEAKSPRILVVTPANIAAIPTRRVVISGRGRSFSAAMKIATMIIISGFMIPRAS